MLLWTLLLLVSISPCSSFLWSLFGNQGCNCCRCPGPPVPQMFSTPFTPAQSFQYFTPPPFPSYQPVNGYTYSQDYTSPSTAMTISYGGPPAAFPHSQEQLQLDERKYSTDQVTYPPADRRPVNAVEIGGNALSQLENELAAEKYKYKQNKANEEKHRMNRIRVFKIKPHKPSIHMNAVEWQASQVAKYTNEKAVDRFLQASSSNDLQEDVEEFIPIEIGDEPELADEQPAGPPPNVRNRISHDPILVLRRRRVIV